MTLARPGGLPGPSSAQVTAPEDAGGWLAALVDDLNAAGLAADLNDTHAGLDVTATVHQPGHKETDIIVDEDGYIELHWWTEPGTTPAAIAAITEHPRRGSRTST